MLIYFYSYDPINYTINYSVILVEIDYINLETT
jgi:hypothetical protein